MPLTQDTLATLALQILCLQILRLLGMLHFYFLLHLSFSIFFDFSKLEDIFSVFGSTDLYFLCSILLECMKSMLILDFVF